MDIKINSVPKMQVLYFTKDFGAASQKNRDFKVGLAAISHLPDIREDKITSIKIKMANNEYDISSRAIADKMLAI